MKAAVFSDSHGETSLMIEALRRTRPDAIIHLGDHDRDAVELRHAFPEIPLYSVCGNCDIMPLAPARDTVQLGPVKAFITHGHLYSVKFGRVDSLVYAAMEAGAKIALFGHTHGGQVNFFGYSPFANLSPGVGSRYLSGWLEENRAAILVSNGVGTSGFPVRVFAPPQVHLITLKSR